MNTNVSPLKTAKHEWFLEEERMKIKENDKSEIASSDDDVSIIKYQL